jgi:hypothetical protein
MIRSEVLTAGGERKGPARALPLAPLCKYEVMRGSVLAHEDAVVRLTGAASALKQSLEYEALSVTGAAYGTLGQRGTRGGVSDEDAKALRQENRALEEQVRNALQIAQQWKRMHQELQRFVVEKLANEAGAGLQ